ncbi:hypothetical protein [Natrialba swarupiae]|uniref:Uncharacterized protein n=1 Tax=Natrialba swarupiae TaxID=2448032 RepID=A0A5D5AIB0_9EURY|nr:hypothetical protein [Natrialba swarupiae]TYT61466.1 hypothetical protein FYC77_13180 [Natrialba swarupiae]
MIDTLERLRQPAHTGTNRCWPCTIANGLLVATVVVALALARRRLAASLVAGVGVAAIGVRGYLVPYTPRFAPQLVDRLPISAFDHEDREGGSLSGITSADETDADSASTPTGEDVVTALLEAGVVVPNGDDLALAEPFRQEWHQEMATIRDLDFATLADEIDDLTGPSIDARIGHDWRGRSTTVLLEGPNGAASLTEHKAVAELAAARALESRIADTAVRLAAGRPLRSLLERCPVCDSQLTITHSSCCGEVTPAGETPAEKLICPDCDARLFTYD